MDQQVILLGKSVAAQTADVWTLLQRTDTRQSPITSFNNNKVHLSCTHQRPERSHDTYYAKYDILYTCIHPHQNDIHLVFREAG